MDDVTSITFFVDRYKACHSVYSRMVVQQQAKKALSIDDYLAFLDFAISWLHIIDPMNSEPLPI